MIKYNVDTRYYGGQKLTTAEAASIAAIDKRIADIRRDYGAVAGEYRDNIDALLHDTPQDIRPIVLTGYLNATDYTADIRAAIIMYYGSDTDPDTWCLAHGWSAPVLRKIAREDMIWQLIPVIDNIAKAYDDPQTPHDVINQTRKTPIRRLVLDDAILCDMGILHRETVSDHFPGIQGCDTDKIDGYNQVRAELETIPYCNRDCVWDRDLLSAAEATLAGITDTAATYYDDYTAWTQRADELRNRATGLTAIRYDRDRVQTTPTADRMADIMDDIATADSSARTAYNNFIALYHAFDDVATAAGLASDQRRAAALRYCLGQTYRQIAATMGKTEDQARYLAQGYSKAHSNRELLLRAISISIVRRTKDWQPGAKVEPLALI
ncbi:MAG: hypothetical protein LIP12_07795 [Clostridiales bacterium]|nr:hypothetical protein [Clostridiales bacterium]